jgi:hypothetical protein
MLTMAEKMKRTTEKTPKKTTEKTPKKDTPSGGVAPVGMKVSLPKNTYFLRMEVLDKPEPIQRKKRRRAAK